MTEYICFTPNGVASIFNTDDVPDISDNQQMLHILKIAITFQHEGIPGVIVDSFREGDRFVYILHLENDSIAKFLIEYFIKEGLKTNHYPSVELAMLYARQCQQHLESRHE